MKQILSLFFVFFCINALAGEPYFYTKAGSKLLEVLVKIQ